MFGYGSGSLRSDCSGFMELHSSLPRCEVTTYNFGEGISETDESMDDASNSHYSEASESGAMSITSSLSSLSLFPYTHRRRNSSTSSNASGSQSPHGKELTLYGICDHVGQDMWKDNPEQDRFNTFSVSETDLTNVIGYLENQIEAHKCKAKNSSCSESSDNVINSVQDDLGEQTVPAKVTFILDTYCHIYMYRWVQCFIVNNLTIRKQDVLKKR